MAQERKMHTPRQARQGEIVLRTHRRRVIFFAGPAAVVIVAIAAPLFA